MTPAQQRQQQRGAQLEVLHARISAFMQQHGITDPSVGFELYKQQTQIVAEQNEVRAYCTRLQPQHVAYLRQLDAQGGLFAVLNALQPTGLSEGALQVIAETYQEAGGFDPLVERVESNLRELGEFNRATRIADSIEAATPREGQQQGQAAILRNSALAEWARNRNEQQAAEEICRLRNIPVPPGQSPLQALFGFTRDAMGYTTREDAEDGDFLNRTRSIGEPKYSPEEVSAALALRLGVDPEDVSGWLGSYEAAEQNHSLTARFAAKDKPMIRLTPEAARNVRSKESRRSVLEAKYEEMDKPAARSRASVARPAPVQRQLSAPEARRAALDRTYEAIDRGEEMPEAEPAAESESRRQLSQAYDRLSEEGEAA